MSDYRPVVYVVGSGHVSVTEEIIQTELKENALIEHVSELGDGVYLDIGSFVEHERREREEQIKPPDPAGQRKRKGKGQKARERKERRERW